MNVLKKRIGIIGGGQLGKMMILDAKRLGYTIVTLDPTPNCPSHSISDEHIIAAFDDESAIRELAQKTDVITYEFEHISVAALQKMEQEGYTIYPSASSLEIIQNKFAQKSVLKSKNIPVPDFKQVSTIEDVVAAAKVFGYPMMLKTCYGGYDGKGNALIKNEELASFAFETLGSGKHPLMVEAFVPFTKEISVLACRGIDGQIVVYPVGENSHVDSILDETIVPANISETCTRMAMSLAHDVMEVFHGVGMFCVEMFVTEDEEVSINEVAPRPHNSGHYTIEGCLTSQFEQHIRAITGLPFGSVELRCPTVMRNLLGDEGADGETFVVGLEDTYKNPNVKVHLYGKETVKAKRKMGHLTAIGTTIEEAIQSAKMAQQQISIQGGYSNV